MLARWVAVEHELRLCPTSPSRLSSASARGVAVEHELASRVVLQGQRLWARAARTWHRCVHQQRRRCMRLLHSCTSPLHLRRKWVLSFLPFISTFDDEVGIRWGRRFRRRRWARQGLHRTSEVSTQARVASVLDSARADRGHLRRIPPSESCPQVRAKVGRRHWWRRMSCTATAKKALYIRSRARRRWMLNCW